MDQENNKPEANEKVTEPNKAKGTFKTKALLYSAKVANFIRGFTKKPWNEVFNTITFENKPRAIAYLLLFAALLSPAVNLVGEYADNWIELKGILGFVFATAALVALVSFAFGLSAKLAKRASQIVLSLIVIGVGFKVWDTVSTTLDLCGRHCGDIFRFLIREMDVSGHIFEWIPLQAYFFLPSFFLLIPCAFSNKFSENENLKSKIVEVNNTKVEIDELTSSDVQATLHRLLGSSEQVVNTALNKLESSSPEVANKMKAGTKYASGKLNEIQGSSNGKYLKPVFGILIVFTLGWLLWPTTVEGPSIRKAEELLKKDPDFQAFNQVAALGALFGGGSNFKVKIKVKELTDCEEYTFDDGDEGVACELTAIVKFGSDSEVVSGRRYFFNHPRNGWEYHGMD